MRRFAGIAAARIVSITVTLASCSTTNKAASGTTNPDAAVEDEPADAQSQVCPGTTVAGCPATVPSFSNVIVPIVQSRCSSCHSQNNDAGLWPLNDQQSLYDWQISILQVLRACTQPPPGSGVSLTLSERKAFEAWLVCGAPNN